MPEPIRCWPTSDPAYIAYHDEEWGRPVRDERGLYERLCLEGFQSGLAWITVLRKREAFRRAFAGFDPERVARFGERDVERLLGDAGIIRHRGKIEAAIANAGATLALREAGTPLDELMWEYRDRADGKELSRRLKAAGFRFVGPTTVYSSMEACGIVNGHRPDCWVRDAVEAERAVALALEDLLQPLEVLAELLLGAPREESRGEAGDVALGGDGQPRPAVGRLELVPDGERHRAVERAQREQARLAPASTISSVVWSSRPSSERDSSTRPSRSVGALHARPARPAGSRRR